MTVVPRLSGLIDRTLVSVTSAVSASVAHEAAGAGREAAIPLVGAPHRIRAVHLELPATHGGLHCHTLLAIEKLTLADTSRPRHGDDKQHETIRFHGCPPSAP